MYYVSIHLDEDKRGFFKVLSIGVEIIENNKKPKIVLVVVKIIMRVDLTNKDSFNILNDGSRIGVSLLVKRI